HESFPADTFEWAVLSKLDEVDPREVLDTGDTPDEAAVLSGEAASIDAELAEAAAFMDAHGFSVTIGKRVQALEQRKRELAPRLAEARQKAAHPLSEAWGETKSLLATLNAAPDQRDARLRLRSALRRIIESIWLLVDSRRGKVRLTAAQIWFAGGRSGQQR